MARHARSPTCTPSCPRPLGESNGCVPTQHIAAVLHCDMWSSTAALHSCLVVLSCSAVVPLPRPMFSCSLPFSTRYVQRTRFALADLRGMLEPHVTSLELCVPPPLPAVMSSSSLCCPPCWVRRSSAAYCAASASSSWWCASCTACPCSSRRSRWGPSCAHTAVTLVIVGSLQAHWSSLLVRAKRAASSLVLHVRADRDGLHRPAQAHELRHAGTHWCRGA